MERGIITISENGAVTIPTVPVWMTQQEMSDAFNVFGCDIRRAIHTIYKNMELLESDTMVIAIAFRLRTKECMAFRRFVMGKLYAASRKEPLCLFFSPAAYSRNGHSC